MAVIVRKIPEKNISTTKLEKIFQRLVYNEGILKQFELKRYYLKPSQQRQAAAKQRARKIRRYQKDLNK